MAQGDSAAAARGAVVVGASRGIGRSLAMHLSGAGFTVAALGRDAAALRELQELCLPGTISSWPCDVAQSASLTQVFESLRVSSPPLSVVVHCAASLGPVGPVWALDVPALTEALSVNVTSAYVTARLALEAMVATGSGRLLMLSSGAAQRPSRFRAAYAGSKASVDHLVRTVGEELRDQAPAVAITGIYPGIVATGMQAQLGQLAGSSPDASVRREMERLVTQAGPGQPPSVVAQSIGELLLRETGEVNGKIFALRAGSWQEA